jgi:23S rRNA (adenine-N6)-dimethyltransferase
MAKARREPLSQHFLNNRRLVDQLVRASSISPDDLVLEIGPGRGIITEALLTAAARVIAVELDPKLCRSLRARLGQHPQLSLIQADFLTAPLPQEPYKVFASIPYSRTGDIFRKLLHAESPPADCWLVVQSEAAAKYCVHPRHNTLAALLLYPWWDIRLTHRFQRVDFAPPPRVDSVLLQITRRAAPLLDPRLTAAYHDYAAFRFERARRANDQSPGQFLGAFQSFVRGASRQQRQSIQGAFARLQGQQGQLLKIHRTRIDPHWKKFQPK